eukprot:g1394.t1
MLWNLKHSEEETATRRSSEEYSSKRVDDMRKMIANSPSRVLRDLGFMEDTVPPADSEGGSTFKLDKSTKESEHDESHPVRNISLEATSPESLLDTSSVVNFVVDFYFEKPQTKGIRYFTYEREAIAATRLDKDGRVRESRNDADRAKLWIVLDIGCSNAKFTPSIEADLVRVLKYAALHRRKRPRILWVVKGAENARFAAYLSVRYGSVWVSSAGDGMHNNCTAFEALLGRAEKQEGSALVVYDVVARGANPFTMCDKAEFEWSGRKFTEPPASDALRKLLDPSFDILFKPPTREENDATFRRHAKGKEARRAVARETIAKLNRVDPALVVCIFYGSESPSKNAYNLASALADLVSARGLNVDKSGPRKLDDLCNDLEGVKGKNVVVVVSTAGVGEFPSGSKKLGEMLFPHALDEFYEKSLASSSSVADNLSIDAFCPRSFAVFGLGDVDYHLSERNKLDSTKTPWSYCTPAKILDRQFRRAPAAPQRLIPVGFGGANTYSKDFEMWSGQLVESLRTRGGAGDGADTKTTSTSTGGGSSSPPPLPQLHPIEIYKMTSKQLKQPLLNEILDPARPDSISEAALQVSKHHGIYQQRRRDELYDDPKAHPACSFMIRLRMPGGTISPSQMRALLKIGETFGNHTMKITTRQTVQYHGVIKSDLIDTIHAMNRACLDTVAACGDVNRNVMCSVVRPAKECSPAVDALYAQVQQVAHAISEQLMPEGLARTWYDIWVARGRNYRATDKKHRFHIGNREIQRFVEKGQNPEPILGKSYLPRKFKVAMAVPPFNDPDVFAHCVGFIAIVNKQDGHLEGFNVSAGGGMGTTKHGLYKAYARLANVIGFCSPEDAKHVALALMEIQRDNGVRTDRSHARFKYTVEDLGVPTIQKEVTRYMLARHRERVAKAKQSGESPPEAPRFETTPRPYQLLTNKDNFGKRINHDRTRDYTLYMQNGRIKDYPKSTIPGRVSNVKFWTAMERACDVVGSSTSSDTKFVFSNNQNITISRVPEALCHRLENVLEDAKIPFRRADIAKKFSPLMLNSMACVAFPTCGLAMAPSETYLPTLIAKIDSIMDDFDFSEDDKNITIRMSGCPNGCSRPYVAEICLVGRSFSPDVGGIYDLFLGGLPSSERLAVRHRTGLNEGEILKELRHILKRFKVFRKTAGGKDVSFGDFVVEAGIVGACRASPIYEAHGTREPAVTFWPRKDPGVRKYLKAMYDENVDGIQKTLRSNYSDQIAKQYTRSLEF